MRRYLSDVVKLLPVSSAQHRVAMVKYSDQIQEEFLMDQKTSSGDIATHIEGMKHSGGNTDIGTALYWAQQYFPRVK